jgi:hypothetical protein
VVKILNINDINIISNMIEPVIVLICLFVVFVILYGGEYIYNLRHFNYIVPEN